ncbi:hypothetical protein, partial [Mycoplasma mycoides]
KKFILILRYILIVSGVVSLFYFPYLIHSSIIYYKRDSFAQGQLAGIIIGCIALMALALLMTVLMLLSLTAKYMNNMKINVAAWCVSIPFFPFIFVAGIVWIGWKIFVVWAGTRRTVTIKEG